MERQLEIWEGIRKKADDSLARKATQFIHQEAELTSSCESEYVSIKRISLVYEGSFEARPVITSSNDAKEFFAKYWRDNPAADQERFVIAMLDTKNRVQGVVVVTTGTLDASLVHPREVFKPAIIEGSSSVIISHNHPSGDITPSKEDRAVTDRLTDAGELLGIDLLDHIIFGDTTGDTLSIREF